MSRLFSDEKASSEEHRVNGLSTNKSLEKKASPAQQLSLMSDSEDDERVASENELRRRFYEPSADRRKYLDKPGLHDRDSGYRPLYGDPSYPTMALASPIQNRLAVQAAMIHANSYLTSFDPQRLKRARQSEFLRAVSQWRTNPNLSKGRSPGGKSTSPFTNVPRKVSLKKFTLYVGHVFSLSASYVYVCVCVLIGSFRAIGTFYFKIETEDIHP